MKPSLTPSRNCSSVISLLIGMPVYFPPPAVPTESPAIPTTSAPASPIMSTVGGASPRAAASLAAAAKHSAMQVAASWPGRIGRWCTDMSPLSTSARSFSASADDAMISALTLVAPGNSSGRWVATWSFSRSLAILRSSFCVGGLGLVPGGVSSGLVRMHSTFLPTTISSPALIPSQPGITRRAQMGSFLFFAGAGESPSESEDDSWSFAYFIRC